MKQQKAQILGQGIVGIKGKNVGPTIGIVCNVHGNEPCGRRAVQRILSNYEIERGHLVLIDGNPEASLLGRRYVDTDMNRVFTERKLSASTRHQDLERAKYLVATIPELGIDHAVDFHSVSSKTAYPFMISFPNTEHLAKLCPMPRVYGWQGIVKGTLCEWMCNAGIPTIVVEAGQHESASAVRHAERTILSILSSYELIELEKPFMYRKQPEFDVTENVQIGDRNSFELSRPYGSFDELAPREIVATDNTKIYRVPDEAGYSILMPTTMELVRNGTASGAYYLMKRRNS